MTALAPSRTAQTARATVAALVAIGIVIGLPWLLIAFAQAPWTWRLSSIERLNVALSWPIPTNTVKYALAIAAWAIWLGLILRLAREILAQLSGRRAASQVRGPIRLLAATLVGSITATAPALAASAEPTTIIAAPVAPCQTEPQQTPEQDPGASTETIPADNYERDVEGNIVHTVARGDNLWDLAKEYYGDPLRHMEIFKANKGVKQNIGGILTNKHTIWPGWELLIPGTAAEPEPTAPADPEPPQEPEESPASNNIEEPPPSATEPDNEAAPDATANTDSADAAPATGRGSWVAGSFLAVSVLAATIALIRRRRKPTDRNTQPKPAARTVTANEGDELTGRLPDLEDLLSRQAEASSSATPLATGTEEKDEISLLDLAGLGLGLTGPGADAAARACLYSAVLSATNVICEHACIEQLGFDPAVLAEVPGLTITTGTEEFIDAARQRRATVVFDDENDELYHEATVAFCNNDTGQAIAELLDDEHTYAIVLGEWEPHWLQLADDGTPNAGNIAQGPISSLGQCYVLDADTGNDLFTRLAEPAPRLPEPAAETAHEPPSPKPLQPAETTPAAPLEADSAGAEDSRFQLQLFGTHRLSWEGEPVSFGRRACLELIAIMAMSNWTLTRDELTEVVAADATLKQARSRRTTIVGDTRKTLTTLTGADGLLYYDHKRETYRLDATWFHTDTAHFEHSLEQAQNTDDPETRSQHLTEALQIYTGPLGADLDEIWDLIDIRKTYRDQAYQAAVALARLHQESGHENQATAVLERASAIAPDRAEAWEQLAALHRRHGDETKAVQAEARAQRNVSHTP